MPVTILSRLRSLWRNLTNREGVERDLDDELGTLHAELIEEKVRAGLTPDAARRAATIELGHIHIVKQHVRDVRAGAFWDAFVQDVRYGARLLWRNPLFTLTASLSLAICLGANTAVFTLANRLLFREHTGVADSGRLVDLAPTDGRKLIQPALPYRAYLEIRDRVTLLDVYGYSLELQPLSMRADGAAERVFGTIVTSSYFTVLGVTPAAGRLFGAGDGEGSGASPVVVLSHTFWKRRFNSDPAIVGQTPQINGHPMTVVGVAAERFNGTSVVVADIWIPGSMASALNLTGNTNMALGGRLRPGVPFTQAAAEVDAIGRTLETAPPPPPSMPGTHVMRGFGLRLSTASAVPPLLRGIAAALLSLLMGVVSIVLAIACANIAGVLLARATARRREIAVRLAMGAGRGRLIRQLLTETLMLFMIGGAAGLLLARVLTTLLLRLVPAMPVPVDLSMPLDARVAMFTAALSLVAALLSGLIPARQASKADVVTALKADAQGPSDRLRLRNAFVVAQVAFSLLLVVAAGLLVRAMYRTTVVDLGFEPKGVEVATLDLSLGRYTADTGPRFVGEVVDRVRALPGIEDAAAASLVPGGGQTRMCCGITVPGATPPHGQPFFQPAWNVVTPGYFTTLGASLVAGRDFSELDRRGSEPVVIVSQAAAREYWPGEDAVGKYVLWQAGSRLISTNPADRKPAPVVRLSVIGVAADLKSGGGQPPPLLYLPFRQHYESDVSIVARAAGGRRLAADIEAVVASVDSNLPVVSSRPLDQFTGPVQFQLRISAGVSAAVGALGMLLAAIGIYGVTAYTVTRRTREIGIRLAMGAERSDVLLMVLRQGMALVMVGSAIGLLLAAASSRVLVRLLFGVPPLDPLTFAASAVLLSLIGLAACYVPARRATRISAVEALRYE
jgi:predicted permease